MTAHDLPPQVRAKVHKADVARNVFWALFVAYLIGITALIGYNTYQARQTADAVRQTQISNTGITHNTHRIVTDVDAVLSQLKDCLTPGGKCHQASQRNQKNVLAQVSELQTYHALCIRDPGVAHTIKAVDMCVESLIRQHGLG